MLKTNISKKNEKQIIEANGSIPELVSDMAILLSSIYSQFQAVSPVAAELFRRGIVAMVSDPNGPAWKPANNQTGIAIQLPEKEDEK